MRGTIGYFDEAAAGWTDKYLRPGHFRTRLETVLSWLPETPSGRILDYGCGSGVLMKALLERGFSVTGMDASPGMLEAASAHLAQTLPESMQAAYRLELAEGGLPAASDDLYEGILCLGVLEYVDHPWEILGRFSKMLRPGGFLIISVPNRQSVFRGVEGWVYRHAGWFRPFSAFRHLTGADSYLAYQRHQFSRAELARGLQTLGLGEQAVRFHVAPGVLESVADHPWTGMTLIGRYCLL